MSVDYFCKVYGKSILAGEHAVLRGSTALVFPVRDFSTDFFYTKTASCLNVTYKGERANEVDLIFPRLLKHALSMLSENRKIDFLGELIIESNLPLGAGLGASAALCVGLTQVFNFVGYLKKEDEHAFATQLENLFHGESSGVDVAVAFEGQPLKFKRGGECSVLKLTWDPHMYLSYSGQKGLTVDCVDKVKEFIKTYPEEGRQIDEQMTRAVLVAEEALTHKFFSKFSNNSDDVERSNIRTVLRELAKAINMAGDCFYKWDLCPKAVDHHIKKLQEFGAIATKPTGSGGGGFVISLWENEPPEEILPNLIKI